MSLPNHQVQEGLDEGRLSRSSRILTSHVSAQVISEGLRFQSRLSSRDDVVLMDPLGPSMELRR